MAGRHDEVISRYGALAQQVATEYGIDPRILLAQIIQEGNVKGAPGNNVMNLTAGSKWTGPIVNRGDTDAAGRKIKQNFRAYDSEEAGIRDYARMFATSDRYKGLRSGTTAERAAALGRSGYAEDPTYGAKITKLALSLPETFTPGAGKREEAPLAPINGPMQMPAQTASTTPPQRQSGSLSGAMGRAMSFNGMNETANADVLGKFMAQKGIPFTPQNVAWCAAFVNSALAEQGLPTTGSNMARSFLKWGQETKTPNQGDIAVFTRGDPRAATGHVGFYGGTVDRNGQQFIRVFGGNQGGAAKGGGEAGWTELPASRLLGYRTQGGGGGTALASNPAQPSSPLPDVAAPDRGVLANTPDPFKALADVTEKRQAEQKARQEAAAAAVAPPPPVQPAPQPMLPPPEPVNYAGLLMPRIRRGLLADDYSSGLLGAA